MMIESVQIEPNVVLAPLAGYTDSPMRRIARSMGAGLVWTEMVSAEGLVRDSRRSMDLLRFEPEERPIAAQLFGARPEAFRGAARMVSSLRPDLIDINAGCPARKVVKSGSGAALMLDTGRVREIVEATVEGAGDIPVTIKTRSGWSDDEPSAVETALAAVAGGARAVAVHPRTRTQGFKGRADWSVIRAVNDAVGVPVMGSGDVATPGDAIRMLDETGAAAVMIGRAAVGNPWLLERSAAALAGERPPPEPDLGGRLRVARRHFTLMLEWKGRPKGVFEMRKHFVAYLRGFPGVSDLRKRIVLIDDPDEVLALLDDALRKVGPEAGGSP
ncbi:MAG: tRNA dihydrouridine synthase DusB [Candidatus Eisenbacteria bacterium]|nr:tRNA dihydrouridine synthase DusB [Candidatus Eisenbacteria bacterium]